MNKRDETKHKARPAAQTKRQAQNKNGWSNAQPAARRVFIDLDDAYGVPFSSAPISLQEYRNG